MFLFYFKKQRISDLLGGNTAELRVLLLKHLKLWSIDQQDKHQQGEISNPTPYPLSQNLYFNQMPQQFTCTGTRTSV